MQTTTIIYLIGALLFSIAVSWFLYFYKSKELRKVDYFLFGLRATSLFLLVLILINPTIERQEFINQKPILSVLVDNSSSVKHFKSEKKVIDFVNLIEKNSAINNKFDVQFFKFGDHITSLDSLSFIENQTNIYKAIDRVEALQKNTVAPVVLISDGNQTTGNLYPQIKTSKNIFPLIIGDTIPKSDLRITQVNVNKYSYLKNRFPVETRIIYNGSKAVKTKFTIEYKGKTIFRRDLLFSSTKKVATISTSIASEEEGVQYYKAFVHSINGEENLTNNSKSFSVEVLNQQTKILVLTSVLHPDLGTLKKAIETNKQRSVTVSDVKTFKGKLTDYQLVIFYQPTTDFKTAFTSINALKINYFVITGSNTNWSFLNNYQSNYRKTITNQTEAFGAIFNKGFLTFKQKDIFFNTLSPLKAIFGNLNFTSKFDALLFQNIAGFETSTPLLATFENDVHKSGVLFGEGIWTWRVESFLNSGSFQDFDDFLSNLVQYLASSKQRERLTLNYEALHPANTPITINAFYVDKNYQFDARAKLKLSLTNSSTNVSQNIPFSLLKNSFEAILDDLPTGNYQFVVSVDNQSILKSGSFQVSAFQIEKQFTNANQSKLSLLAENTNGTSYCISDGKQFMTNLLADKRYVSKQISKVTTQELIAWRSILIAIVIFLSIEWFVRKYLGKI